MVRRRRLKCYDTRILRVRAGVIDCIWFFLSRFGKCDVLYRRCVEGPRFQRGEEIVNVSAPTTINLIVLIQPIYIATVEVVVIIHQRDSKPPSTTDIVLAI